MKQYEKLMNLITDNIYTLPKWRELITEAVFDLAEKFEELEKKINSTRREK